MAKQALLWSGDTMARKAVQGYTDKSFYDNTRYTGVVATNDPLNEGYFKHLINFDISDTGQSITPRKGFLTTTLCAVDNTTLIALSDKTIMYQEQSMQAAVIFDFKNNKGYIADVSAYNVVNKLLPITQEIAVLDWNDVLDYLYTNVTWVKAFYDSYETGTHADKYALLLIEVQKGLGLYNGTKFEHIYDDKLIHKIIIKMNLTNGVAPDVTEHPFIIEMYYRKDAITIDSVPYPANTLTFGVVDTTQICSYNPLMRNIASPNSIIPNPMQVLYREDNRPSGFVNTFGMIYTKKSDNEYMTAYVDKAATYSLIPHFELNPASLSGAGEVIDPDTAQWAYRFDVVSTKLGANPTKETTTFRSPWFNLTQVDGVNQPVFNNKPATSDLTAANRADRHYKGTRYIITLVPAAPVVIPDDGWYDHDAFLSDVSENFYGSILFRRTTVFTVPQAIDDQLSLYESWTSLLTSALITTKEKLIAAIKTLAATTLFSFVDLSGPGSVGAPLVGTTELNTTTDYNGIQSQPFLSKPINKTYPTYESGFLTASQLVAKIETGELDTAMLLDNFTFRFCPVALHVYGDASGATGNIDPFYALMSMKHFQKAGQYASHVEMLPIYNAFLYTHTTQTFNIDIATNTSGIGITTTTLISNSFPMCDVPRFFETGYVVTFYLKPYRASDLADKTYSDLKVIQESWNVSANVQTLQMPFNSDSFARTTLNIFQVGDPDNFKVLKNFLVFNQSYLVAWYNNVLYISESGTYYYFKEACKKEFGERIVKVIQYKSILLVFTVQHLYAVYLFEIVKGTETTPAVFEWASQAVLYNILASDKYADVIQVFNQMVLFYSEDGQMFMIKPNVMVDTDTRFTLQYFNKSANDILANYDKYINERLANYNIEDRITKDDVQIKALVSINTIKIFYYVPGYITYILVYDVINNRYYCYDTVTFTTIADKIYTESGELYITTQDAKTYFTVPYLEINTVDAYCDMTIVNNFQKVGVSTLLDTGNLNLNNHIRKRFRDMYVVFKNLSSSKLLFNAETVIDDIVSRPYYDTQLEVKEIGGVSYFMTVPKSNHNDIIDMVNINQISEVASNAFLHALNNNLFEENNVLLDFSDYTSSKLLTHRSSILGMGRVFRLKLQFVSKGAYKIQSFGIVYKERRL